MAGTVGTLNGVAVSWAELEATASIVGGASLPDLDFKSIDHETAVARGEQRGPGGKLKKRTTGQPTDTASASVYRDALTSLKRGLMAIAPKDAAGRPQLSKAKFDVVIKHSYPEDATIYIVKLLRCSLDKNAFKHAEGVDADTVDIDLNPMEIVEVIDGQDTVLL